MHDITPKTCNQYLDKSYVKVYIIVNNLIHGSINQQQGPLVKKIGSVPPTKLSISTELQ